MKLIDIVEELEKTVKSLKLRVNYLESITDTPIDYTKSETLQGLTSGSEITKCENIIPNLGCESVLNKEQQDELFDISKPIEDKNPCPYVNFVDEENIMYKSLLKRYMRHVFHFTEDNFIYNEDVGSRYSARLSEEDRELLKEMSEGHND